MAHAKTSAAHIAAQIGVGLALAAAWSYSLRDDSPAQPAAAASAVEALDAETRAQTTGKLWGLPPADDAPRPRPPGAA
jgi:hypothetical protein